MVIAGAVEGDLVSWVTSNSGCGGAFSSALTVGNGSEVVIPANSLYESTWFLCYGALNASSDSDFFNLHNAVDVGPIVLKAISSSGM